MAIFTKKVIFKCIYYFITERLYFQVGKFKKKNKVSSDRTRNYATVVYPDSAPENWLDILSNEHVPAFVSPLHDRDTNPTGESKKSHWHVMVMFDGVKTVGQAKNLFDKIGGVGCEVVKSIRGSARYLCHMDNPEKAQYKPEDVKCFGGADYNSVCSLPADRNKIIREMINFCDQNKIFSFAWLIRYSMDEKPDWFNSLCSNSTYVIKEYLKSKRWEYEQRLDTNNT